MKTGNATQCVSAVVTYLELVQELVSQLTQFNNQVLLAVRDQPAGMHQQHTHILRRIQREKSSFTLTDVKEVKRSLVWRFKQHGRGVQRDVSTRV